MGFNVKKFMTTAFIPRTAEVRVDGLIDFFETGENPVWIVRGQTANEIAAANDAATKNKNIESIIQAIANSKAQIEDLRAAIGVAGADVSSEVIRRLEQLTSCSVDPKIDMPAAVKLAEAKPIEFFILTNKIVELTGLGMDIKKSMPSGKTKDSETL